MSTPPRNPTRIFHSIFFELATLLRFIKKTVYDFGANISTISLYSDADGSLQNISIIFANKGDYGSNFGFAEKHQEGDIQYQKKTLSEAITDDARSIKSTLTNVLGLGKEQRFGERDTRRTVSRWDFQDQSILLSIQDREYVSVSIVPQNFAESGGRTSSVRDADIRERIAQLVKHHDNGDIIITDIPMVDQGPKGYCVPATFERTMRHMGMAADMYLLAMVGGTHRGGGTNVEELIENVKSATYSKGRRIKEIEKDELKIQDLQRYIDIGIPLLWTMYSNPIYNSVANKRTVERKSITNWNEWTEHVQKEAVSNVNKMRLATGSHICMITGYNSKTQELAVSDSWGPKYETRWVSLAEANAVHQGRLYAIVP